MSKIFYSISNNISGESYKEKCKSFYYIYSFWSPPMHSIENYTFQIQIMLLEILKNLGKSYVTHILPAKEQTTKK